jgi:3-oxoacyl-(acyl-carrier-protein) synthase
MKAVAAAGERGAVQLVMATHAGMTVDQFRQTVSDWLATATDPKISQAVQRVHLSADG